MWVLVHLFLIKFLTLFFSLDFNKPVELDDLAASMLSTGFQATNVGLAIEEINRMVRFYPIFLALSYLCCSSIGV